MSSSIALHPAPGAGFDQPFEMLAECHGRVERMASLLLRLREHMAAGQADAQARQAAVDLMRYFDSAAPHHHQDEERHVFPRLRASGDATLAALADALQAEHVRLHDAWAALRPGLLALSEGRWDVSGDEALFAQWQAFTAAYRAHAALEDGQAFPAARLRCAAADLAAMGDEMARRRGVR